MKFNKSELILGFLSTILLTTKLGWIGLSLSTITALLWAIGGTWKTIVRRLGVPLAVSIYTGVWWSMLGIIPLLIGDGYPSTQPPDEGSWLGQKVYKLGLGPGIEGFVTKLIPVLLLQVCWIPIFLR